MRKFPLILLLFCCLGSFTARAEGELQIDSAYVAKFKVLNDYSLLGIQYGVGLSIPNMQPTRNTKMTIDPVSVGITYTRYGKLFGYMPYFGIQLGVFYNQESFQFATQKSGYTDHILGASRYDLKLIEVPAMAHLHFDFWKMKVMANIGIFGGYRLGIQRSNYTSDSYSEQYGEYKNKFHPVENRFDYGLKAGAGFGLMLDPVEVHLMVWYKLSWMNLHQPDRDRLYQESKYYYYWTYPSSINVSISLNFQLNRTHGSTKSQLRKMAKEEVMEMVRAARELAQQKDTTQVADSLSVPNAGMPLPEMTDKASEENK